MLHGKEFIGSCGLLVVSTAVGGIPEVLPPDMVVLARPDVNGIVQYILSSLLNLKALTG